MDFPKALAGSKKLKSFVKPMLASSAQQAFNDQNWIAEIKYDGYRAVAHSGKTIQLTSRNGTSFLKAFPKIVRELEKLKFDSILDGEVVVMDPKTGLPSFNGLQNYNSNSGTPIYFYVFDCLEYDGQDLRNKTLLERKQVLQSLFDCEGVIRFCDHVDGDSMINLFDQVTHMGLEGIICKRANSKYHEGDRSKDWIKIKNYQQQEYFILGYGTEEFSLLLGEAVDGKLLYRGEVGTGWTDKTRTKLYKLLSSSTPPPKQYLDKLPKIKAKWVHPQYMCKVKYLDLTRDGQVRHSVFIRLL